MGGEKIRRFFRELFGSRYIQHLEDELLRVRQDCDLRLRDKDIMLASLQQDKAQLQVKLATAERVAMPSLARAQNPERKLPNWDLSSMPPVKTSWQILQEENEKRIAEEDAAEKAAAAGKG